jgi:hypothetical protein
VDAVRLNLWRLIGHLWIDDRGYLRYRVTLSSSKVAQLVQDHAGHCSVRRGQVLFTGSNVWYGLSLMYAPQAVITAAREYRTGGDPGDLMAVLEDHMEVVDELAD